MDSMETSDELGDLDQEMSGIQSAGYVHITYVCMFVFPFPGGLDARNSEHDDILPFSTIQLVAVQGIRKHLSTCLGFHI